MIALHVWCVIEKGTLICDCRIQGRVHGWRLFEKVTPASDLESERLYAQIYNYMYIFVNGDQQTSVLSHRRMDVVC